MKASPSAPPSARLADYGALLRRQWRVVVGVSLAGLILGVGFLLFAPTVYTATASVLVSPTGVKDPTPLVNGRAPAKINLDTEAQIVTSTRVARRVAKKYQSDMSVNELVQGVSIAVPPNSAILEISYHARTPRAAMRGAQSFAKAYLWHRENAAQASVNERIDALRKTLSTQTQKIDSVAARISKLPKGSSDYLLARARREWLTQQVSSLGSEVSELTTTPITPGTVISGARLPTQPSGPSMPLHTTTGLMAGLLAGVVTAQLRDWKNAATNGPDMSVTAPVGHREKAGT